MKYIKLRQGRGKNTQLTTLRKPHGSLTKDTSETLQNMQEFFVPEDKLTDDNDQHTQTRLQSQAPVDTVDDKELNIEEIRNTIGSMGNKKAPGEDGITGEIYKNTFQIFPTYLTLSCRTTYVCHSSRLTSRCCILYIYSTNTRTEYFKLSAHSPIFLFKMPFIS
jgi:hypothetical protein